MQFADGLEALGTDEYTSDGKWLYGVFDESAVERVELPSTLKRIEYYAFKKCKDLKSIDLPRKLEYLGKWCFFESGLQSIAIPSATKVLDRYAFYLCANLVSVQLQDGLECIGKCCFSETKI